MEIVWIIYLIDVVMGTYIQWQWLVSLYVVTFVGMSLYYGDNPGEAENGIFNEVYNTLGKFVKPLLFFVVLSVLINTFTPSKDTAYKMLAAYGVTELVKSEEAQKLGGKSLEVLEKAMDEYLGDKKEE
jgi:hypothetical protein